MGTSADVVVHRAARHIHPVSPKLERARADLSAAAQSGVQVRHGGNLHRGPWLHNLLLLE
jgi:hypothetical protein